MPDEIMRKLKLQPIAVLLVLLAGFLLLLGLLPLSTAIRIGADEGYELSKATLWLKGYKLYSEIWNDQPPLLTFLVTQILKHVSASPLGPRLLTVGFSVLLLVSVFFMRLRLGGLMTATLTTAFVIASPGFLELSCSAMLELPGLAPAVAGVALLFNSKSREVGAGLLFAVALQTKLIGVIYLPLVAVLLWLRSYGWKRPDRRIFLRLLLFGLALVFGFVAIDMLVSPGSIWLQLKQSWASHFAATKSLEYGSPADRPFEWQILLSNWDMTIPALLGLIVSCRVARTNPLAILPAIWLVLMLSIFAIHRPWWAYYYVHIAVPMCWCAAIGVAEVLRLLKSGKNLGWRLAFATYCLAASVWMAARLYLQVVDIRHLPQTYSSLVLGEIARLKPHTKFIYADEPIYSFHAGIPVPPKLAIMALKRFWSGDLTNEKLVQELRLVQPGLMLLNNDTRESPLAGLVQADYRLIYEDASFRLYASKTLLAEARKAPSGK